MAEPRDDLQTVRRQLALTRAGLWAERLTHAFWPAWTALFAGIAIWAWDVVPQPWDLSLLALVVLLTVVFVVLGVRGFRAPKAADAQSRLDATLPGRPLTTLTDEQAIGSGDPESHAVWQRHRIRMQERLADAKAVPPDLRVSRRDPYALRYMAVLILAVAMLFGTVWRGPIVPATAGGGQVAATGSEWEGWLQPPRHTGLPTLYLGDIPPGEVEVPVGTLVTLRLYGEAGGVSVTETVSGRSITDPISPIQDFEVTRSGTLAIDGAEGNPIWSLSATPDAAPSIALDGAPGFEFPDQTTLPWQAQDDHGIVSARVTFELDGGAPHPHGLSVPPEPRDPLVMDLPLPISGDRADIRQVLRAQLFEHPMAGMPIIARLEAEDAAGQIGTAYESFILPARPFYDPVAAALVEQRRDILWSRANQTRVSQVLRAVTWRGNETFDNPGAFLMTRMAIRRLEVPELSVEARDEIAEILWEAAIRLEENSLDSALERLRQAQERLSEAIRQGADPEEIARLMDEMRRAMDDYTRQLAQQQGQQGQQQQQAQQGESQQITPNMLDEMMQRIEELMQQGRTAEAQELLRQLQEMMENLQVTQGPGGQGEGQQGAGEQAMEDLRESLREQQGLSDDAFRELQEQFNPNAQAGQSQQNQGRSGDQGQGQQHSEGQDGQGQAGNPSGQQSQQGQQQGGGNPSAEPGQQQGSPGDLAGRQRALREGIETLRNNLPGAGSEGGDAARDALDRAENAMREAERDLADGNLGEALNDQAEAMDALRDGMQALGRALADQRQDGQPGESQNQAGQREGEGVLRDPLGRQSGEGSLLGSDGDLPGGVDQAGRARDLMDEIRRRSGERDRPQMELDYLRRLLDRF
ncbi:MAG: DUF4175 domain-containing protein [Pseudomonadota bacterium]